MFENIVVSAVKYYVPFERLGSGTFGVVFRAHPHSKIYEGRNETRDSVVIKLSPLIDCAHFASADLVEVFVSEVLLNVYLRQRDAKKRTAGAWCDSVCSTSVVCAIGYGFTVYEPIGGSSPLGYMVYADENASSLCDASLSNCPAVARYPSQTALMAARALRALHATGIVHVDVHTRNMVAIGNQNECPKAVKIIDLGSAGVDDAHIDEIVAQADSTMLRVLERKTKNILALHGSTTNEHEFTWVMGTIRTINARKIMECSGIAERPGVDPVHILKDTMLRVDVFSRRADIHAFGALYAELLSSVTIDGAESLAKARASKKAHDNVAIRELLNVLLDDRDELSLDEVIARLEVIVERGAR